VAVDALGITADTRGDPTPGDDAVVVRYQAHWRRLLSLV
jgi:hypothetical protein